MKKYCQRPVNLDEELESLWQAYKAKHPEKSYGGVMKSLLREFLESQEDSRCATSATSSTIQ